MLCNDGDGDYIRLKDKHGKISNEMILIVAKPGGAKTILSETFAQSYFERGQYTVIIIADPKLENEWNFQQFIPEDEIHLDNLKWTGKEPKGMPLIHYEPFSFNTPKHNLPKIKFFTFPIKELERNDFGFLFETESDKETIRLVLNNVKELKKDEGLYDLVNKIQKAISGKKVDGKKKSNPKAFFTKTSEGTTIKSLSEIVSYLLPFEEDYFLASEDSPINIDWRELLNDNKHYHSFNTSFLKDEKIRDFVTLALLNSIMRNKQYAKKPILVIIPEIRKICPQKTESHKKFLAIGVKEAMSVGRSTGAGMSFLSDSQVYQDINKNIRDTSSVTFFGELGGLSDIDGVAKALSYSKEQRTQLIKMDYPFGFIKKGAEEEGCFKPLFPSGMHCEERYNYWDMCRRLKPNEQQKYIKLIEMMKERYTKEHNKFKEKTKKEEKEEKELNEKIKQEKENQESEGEKEQKQKKEKKQSQEKERLIRIVCTEKIEKENKGEKCSTRILAKKFELNAMMVQRILKDNLEKIKKELEEEQEENTPDFG